MKFKILTAAIALLAFTGAKQADELPICGPQAEVGKICQVAPRITADQAWKNTAQCLNDAKKASPTWDAFRAACQAQGRIYDEACERDGPCKRSYDEVIRFLQSEAKQTTDVAPAPKAPPVGMPPLPPTNMNLYCVAEVYRDYVVSRRSDIDVMDRCHATNDAQIAWVLARVMEMQINRRPIGPTPFKDAHCQATYSGFTCTYKGVATQMTTLRALG
jgi:hypothetical protein